MIRPPGSEPSSDFHISCSLYSLHPAAVSLPELSWGPSATILVQVPSTVAGPHLLLQVVGLLPEIHWAVRLCASLNDGHYIYHSASPAVFSAFSSLSIKLIARETILTTYIPFTLSSLFQKPSCHKRRLWPGEGSGRLEGSSKFLSGSMIPKYWKLFFNKDNFQGLH